MNVAYILVQYQEIHKRASMGEGAGMGSEDEERLRYV